MASAFTRWTAQVAVTAQGTSLDLVSRLPANQKLVISSLRAVAVTPDASTFWLLRIPELPNDESADTAIMAGEPVMPMRPAEARGLVVPSGEGLAVAIQYPAGTTPKVVVTAFGELETIS